MIDPSFILTLILVGVRLYGAFNSILSDCDEVYNYWEPLNLLTRYFGKKTWEYQPEYAIRSWTYLLQYALMKYPVKWIQKSLEISGAFKKGIIPAYTFFYLVRVILGATFAWAECHLADTITLISPEMSNWFLLFEIFSPGVFEASNSLLPSSFALLMGMLSTASIIKYFRYDNFSLKIEMDTINNKIKKACNAADKSVDLTADLEETTISDTTCDFSDTTIAGTEAETEKSPSSSSFKGLSTAQIFFCTLYRDALAGRDRYFAIAIATASIGGLIGWPFALALTAPFVFYVFFSILFRKPAPSPLNKIGNKRWMLFIYFLSGVSCVYMVVWTASQIDMLFYGKKVYVPFNIVLYNVLHATKETGPGIFGTESTSYYFVNLLLNFHIIFVFAILDMFTFKSQASRISYLQSVITYKAPLLLWLFIFTAQPHKEERFMYPAYHLISMSAGAFACKLVRLLGNEHRRILLYQFSKLVLLLTCALCGSLRIIGVVKNYGAPLVTFKALSNQQSTGELENVCIGREWYHYPSSFFLTSNQRLRYVPNGFRGMLPGDFEEPSEKTLSALMNSTRKTQPGFNNKNDYNPNFVLPNMDSCQYYVDINMPVDVSQDEISVFNKEGGSLLDYWKTIRCERMIDPDNSYGLAKLIYIPWKEIDYLKSSLEIIAQSEQVRRLRDSSLYLALTNSSSYEPIMRNGLVQKVLDPATYKVITNNPTINKVHQAIEANIVKVANELQLSKILPGKIAYHDFCIAKRR